MLEMEAGMEPEIRFPPSCLAPRLWAFLHCVFRENSFLTFRENSLQFPIKLEFYTHSPIRNYRGSAIIVMGQQQSKGELLYQQVTETNVEAIKALHSEGASLEWTDKEGKTPLIAACLDLKLYSVARTLIELGANVNAYRPGRRAGTPLHHAAKGGLESTVKLLLSHGANALMMNDDWQTPLDVARAKGHSSIVRSIESHICLFSGWMREFYGPGFLELLAPQLVSRKVWVVVVPCGTRNPVKHPKLQLAIYSNFQDAKPCTVIALWKANLDDLRIHEPEPTVTIIDNSRIPRGRRRRRNAYTYQERCTARSLRQTRIKLAPANETDKQQLQWFSDACKGTPQAMPPAFLHMHAAPPTAPPPMEDLELDLAISASVQSSSADVAPYVSALSITESGPSSSDQITKNNNVHDSNEIVEDGPVQYPPIDSSPVDVSVIAAETGGHASPVLEQGGASPSCVICLDAPVEGACVPCGHMAGCMSCLNEIVEKKWGCPVCRAEINQIIRLYAV